MASERTASRPFALLALALLLVLPTLGACARDDHGPSTFRIPSAEYAIYFDSARDVLREYHFDLERVDARAGVITTRPVAAAGWATPWIDHASTWTQATDDLLHRNRRTASILFAPVARETNISRAVDPTTGDLRTFEGTVEVSVSVILEEVYRPGRRVSPTSIRLTSFTVNPADGDLDVQQLRTKTVGADSTLARRIADSLREHAR